MIDPRRHQMKFVFAPFKFKTFKTRLMADGFQQNPEQFIVNAVTEGVYIHSTPADLSFSLSLIGKLSKLFHWIPTMASYLPTFSDDCPAQHGGPVAWVFVRPVRLNWPPAPETCYRNRFYQVSCRWSQQPNTFTATQKGGLFLVHKDDSQR